MRLQIQIILLFVPIFLAMIVTTGISQYYTERDELRWGAKEEIMAFAISIAEFVDPALFSENIHSSTSSTSLSKFKAPLQQIFSHGLIRHLAFYPKNSNVSCFELGEDPVVPINSFLSDYRGKIQQDIDSNKHSNHTIVSDFHTANSPNFPDTLYAIAPVTDGVGNLLGIVALEKDISYISQELFHIMELMIVDGIVLICLGILVLVLLSNLIDRSIRRLTTTFSNSTPEGEMTYIESMPIREFHELGQAYNIMSDVLEEQKKRKTETNFMISPYLSSEYEYTKYFQEYWKPIHITYHPFRIAGCMIGFPKDHFFTIIQTKSVSRCIAGQLDWHTSDSLNALMNTSSLNTFLHSYLKENAIPDVYSYLIDITQVKQFQGVEIGYPIETSKKYSMEPDSPPFLKESFLQIDSEPYFFHTFSAEYTEIFKMFLQHELNMKSKLEISTLCDAFSEEIEGSLVILQ